LCLAVFGASPSGAPAAPASDLPDLLVNDDGLALTYEIFRDAKVGGAKTHWISLDPNYYFGSVDPRWIPVEPYESVDDWAAVRWAGLGEVAPEASIGLALCVNLSKPWPYAFDEGVYPEHPVWGKDPLLPFIDWCRAKGINPYFSIRMNDQHHSVHNHPMYHRGRFFWDRPELFLDPPSPEEWEEHYLPWINTGENVPEPLPESYRNRGENYHDLRVNYAFEEVRDFYVGLATDLAERHPDVDGIELDFMRSRKFFPDGEEEPGKLTAVVRRIRENVDRIAAESGKPIRIVARVPTFHDGYAAGMRVRQWLDEGLLDGIILGHGNMISDNPMEEWAAYAKEREVKVYGPIERMYLSSARLREATPETTRGAASTAYGKGADGLYFFNWFAPEEHYLLPQLDDPEALSEMSKRYFADTARIARQGRDFGSRQIRTPLRHRPGESASVYRFGLFINTDFEAACDTRLTVHTENIRREFINVTVNGRDVTDEMRLVYGANRLSYRVPDALTRELLRNGPNEIDVSLAPNPFDEDLVIEGVTASFLY
jgi:hypothetical protein